jgi:hypothetical protein
VIDDQPDNVVRNIAAGFIGISLLGSHLQVPQTPLENTPLILSGGLKHFSTDISGSIQDFLYNNTLFATTNALIGTGADFIGEVIQTSPKSAAAFTTELSRQMEPEYFQIVNDPRTQTPIFPLTEESPLYTTMDSPLTGLTINPSTLFPVEEEADLEAYLQEFTERYGPLGISMLLNAFSAGEHADRRRELIRLIGEERNPATYQVRRQNLLEFIEAELAGDRLAAASALGRLGDPSTLPALRNRAERENSRIAKSVMLANIEVLQKYAATTQATC